MQRVSSSGEKITHKLSFAIHKSRYILIGLLGGFVILVVTWLVAGEIKSNRIESSTILVESAQKKFEQLLNEEDEERIAAIREELVSDLNRIIDEHPKLYAGQRALHLLGSYYFTLEEWELSQKAFLKLADRFPKSYLAPVSRINAAVALEEAGEYSRAIETYEQIIAKHKDSSPEIARVLFSLGRLNELHGTHEAAFEYYNRMVDDYGRSSWTKLAQDRIIYLNLD